MCSDTKISKSATYRRTQGPSNSRRSREKGSKEEKSNGLTSPGTWKRGPTNNSRDSETDGSDMCIICAEKLRYIALSPCSHKTCHVCAFRQRALYGKKACLICRTENDNLFFTDKLDAEFCEIGDSAVINEEFGITFASMDIANVTLDLLKFTCSTGDCSRDTDFGSYKKLNEHLKSIHSKTLCMICAVNKHAFPSELRIYTPNQLRNHQSKGESAGFKGHPMCGFCSGLRFYSDDELYVHMRNHHEKCHICEKIDPSSPQHFRDYDQLFEHFKNCHYVCTHPICLENKFVVFRDELELQAHILKEHGDMIRGRPRLFQSELSTFVSAPSRVIREDEHFDGPSRSASSRRDNTNESPKVKKLRLQERAKFYLGNSTEEYEKFENLNDAFDRGKLSAQNLLSSYEQLFTSPEADIYLLIHNLSEVYHITSQKFKDLNAIYQTHEQQISRKQELPSLSRDSSSSVALVNSVWSANNNSVSTSHGRGFNAANLPSLTSLPPRDPFSPLKSNSYKNLSQTKKKSPSPVVKTAPSNNTVNFTPTYLDKKRNTNSSGSNLNKGQSKLAALNLPTLPTPKPRAYVPPLNKSNIPDPKNWGKQLAPTEPTDDIGNLTLGSTSSKSKKKGKQKQLLFHIGI